jgi:hypothetical protein
MNKQEIKEASAAGNSNWEVLHMVVAAGREFPDAVFAVSQALRMDAEEVAEMEANYDECC